MTFRMWCMNRLLSKTILALVLCLQMPLVMAQTALQCKIVTMTREASSQSLRGAKAILDVVANRQRIDKMSACAVVKRTGAFPWSAEQKSWSFTQEQLVRYFAAFQLPRQLSYNVYSFNNQPFVSLRKKYCCKIEDHFFYYK